MDTNPTFREEQRFAGWLRWLILADVVLVAAVVAVLMYWLGGREGEPVPLIVYLLILLVPFGVALLFFVSRMITEVRPDGVYVRYIPFHVSYKRFAFDDIAEFAARQYRPLREYGGWGIRFGKQGKAYNVSGDQGVQIVFRSGKKLLIGSQKPDQLEAAIAAAMTR